MKSRRSLLRWWTPETAFVEPVTGKPVSLIAASDVKSFGDEPVGVLMIPFRAVGTKAEFLPGILFDRMEIVSERVRE